jgi:major membrane immunogen (membrane-anchored lipoprotein)
MPFDFTYEVKDDPTYQDFSHSEASDGKVVTGSYRVSLPDGRIQIVSYKADENGYVADVKYEGEAKYPAPESYNKPAPKY